MGRSSCNGNFYGIEGKFFTKKRVLEHRNRVQRGCGLSNLQNFHILMGWGSEQPGLILKVALLWARGGPRWTVDVSSNMYISMIFKIMIFFFFSLVKRLAAVLFSASMLSLLEYLLWILLVLNQELKMVCWSLDSNLNGWLCGTGCSHFQCSGW